VTGQGLVPLGSVADFVNGAAFKPSDWEESGAPIIRIQNLTDPGKPFNRTNRLVSERIRAIPGDLLVSWSATLGVFEWAGPEEAVVNQHIFRVIPRAERVDKRYLRHVLEGALTDMERHLHGATMRHVNRKEFLGTPIPLPTLPEQRRIANILDQADTLRFKRRSALAQLDAVVPSVFIEMFGDPANNPVRWPIARLGDLARQVTDGEHKTPTRSTSGIKLLSARNVRDGYIDFENVDFISVAEYERISRRCDPKRGDLLISCSGTIGRVAPVITSESFSLVRSAALVRPNPERVTTVFLEHYLRTPALKRLMLQRANASSQANLFQNQIRDLPTFVPDLKAQRQFETEANSIVQLTVLQRESLNQHDALFASLQHRAFRGEL
jgi:type I restriction enzyme, S subunit